MDKKLGNDKGYKLAQISDVAIELSSGIWGLIRFAPILELQYRGSYLHEKLLGCPFDSMIIKLQTSPSTPSLSHFHLQQVITAMSKLHSQSALLRA